MKILAVRVAEIGCFSHPVALEGLTAGLNVLAGANELGKSTLLAAMRMAFDQSYKTTSSKVEALRPYSGGAPLVEVDFALGSDTWRLRKQFLSGRSAELRNLTTGQIARNGDAEEQLAHLLGQTGGRSSFSLLWADQQDALMPVAPDTEGAATLKRVVASQIAATVGGSEARDVRTALRAELDQVLTNHKPPRPKGEYDASIKAVARLKGDLALATGRRDAALARLDRLSALKSDEAILCDPAEVAVRSEAARAAQAAALAARDAQQKLRAADGAVTTAESRLDLARNKREALAADLRALEALSAQVIVDQDGSRDIASALAEAETQAADAREVRDRARETLAQAERELKAAAAAEQRQAAAGRLAQLIDTQAAADAAIAAGLDLRTRLDAIRLTPDVLRAVRSEHDAVRRLEDRRAAAAPRVTIAYAPGGAGRILDGTMPLQEGAHQVDRPLVLTIEGIGTIEIAPGLSSDAAATEQSLAQHRSELTRLLGEAGVASLAEAEALLDDRQRLEGELGEARARVGALLPPGGLAKLKDEIASLTLRAAGEEVDTRLRADIEHDIDSIRATLRDCEPAYEAAHGELSQCRQAAARHAASSEDRLNRLSDLERRLPAAAARDTLAQELQSAASDCERALHAAVREAAAWREKAPDHERLQAIEAEAVRTAEAVKIFERRSEETRRTIASLEGELRADRNDDVEARVAELESALAVATRRHARIEEDIAALQLLDSELRIEEMRSQDQYLRPISERLLPYVGLVFPDADVTVAENFAPASLRRSNDREAIAALSGGTQEQLAVMVRLAFGRLMADSGSPVPVILDDALVYSDDERILRMFAALIAAARHHQLIVLTCRSRTFSSLDAHRLSLTPWHRDTTSDRLLSAVS